MSGFYERLEFLCKRRGITFYRMCKSTGISASVITDLKVGRRKGVNAASAERLATYFGVTISYLLGKGELDEEQADIAEYVDELKNREDMRRLFCLVKGATKEDIERTVKIIEALKTVNA